MAKIITEIDLRDEESFDSLEAAADAAMTPGEIVQALVQLDGEDLDDVMKGLQRHYADNIVGVE
jgi:hypothetical protein